MVLPILNSPIMYAAKKKATKFQNAAHKTAWNGVSTLVETMVAIELAASWKPLIKSNIKAVLYLHQALRRSCCRTLNFQEHHFRIQGNK